MNTVIYINIDLFFYLSSNFIKKAIELISKSCIIPFCSFYCLLSVYLG